MSLFLYFPSSHTAFHSLDSEVNSDTGTSLSATIAAVAAGDLGFRPPSGFTDSREFSEAECDREQRALDLEVQRVMENTDGQLAKMDREELTSLLARYINKFMHIIITIKVFHKMSR